MRTGARAPGWRRASGAADEPYADALGDAAPRHDAARSVVDDRRRLVAAAPAGLDEPPHGVDVLAEAQLRSNPPIARSASARTTSAAAGT